MAQAGFVFIEHDCVQCVYCLHYLEEWKAEDDPFIEHQKVSPYCPYLEMFEEPPKQISVAQALQLELKRLRIEFYKACSKLE